MMVCDGFMMVSFMAFYGIPSLGVYVGGSDGSEFGIFG